MDSQRFAIIETVGVFLPLDIHFYLEFFKL